MRKRAFCKECSQIYDRSDGYNNKYCSAECADRAKFRPPQQAPPPIQGKPRNFPVKKELEPKEDFYKSRTWLEIRYRILKKYGPKCMLCGETKPPIQIDHIKPRSKYPELSINEDNLQVLCVECNLGKSNLDETDFRPK